MTTTLDHEDAIDWCNTCAGPIFPGMPATIVEAESIRVVDRHGDYNVVILPRMAWHTNPDHCSPIFPAESDDE